MDAGHFSMSFAVKDIRKSADFYAAFGFEKLDGNIEQNWLILKKGETKIGLFQGMFEDDMLTFNPADARAVEASLKAAGIEIEKPTEGTSGPAHFTVLDPDGRRILVDSF